jgi:hypothetical protein
VSPSIHRDALAYERSRPGYPAEVVDALVAALPGRDVIDLAAGTGKLTLARPSTAIRRVSPNTHPTRPGWHG